MDKPQNDNIGLFMLDLFCTFAAVGLIGFCIYIAPYVFTGKQYYDVPAFIVRMSDWYRHEKELAGLSLGFAMFFPFMLGAFGFFSLAKLISGYIHRLDAKAKARAQAANQTQELNEREGMVAATRVSVIMFLLIIVVIMFLLLIEFLFSSSI